MKDYLDIYTDLVLTGIDPDEAEVMAQDMLDDYKEGETGRGFQIVDNDGEVDYDD